MKKNKKPNKSKFRKSVQPQLHSRDEISCALCQCNILEGEHWPGDVSAVFSLLDRPMGGPRRICRHCGEAARLLVSQAIQDWNRKRPELRLRQYPFRDATFGDPIPNLKVCSDYYDQCSSTQNEEGAANRIGALLLQFERDYPVEWQCSGWKNDFIAELVLGQISRGEVRERKQSAYFWFSGHWAYVLKLDREITVDSSEVRKRALGAVLELQALEDDDFHPPDETLSFYAKFIRWLSANVRKLPYEPGNEKFIFSAVKTFRREQPQSTLRNKVLAEIAAAFGCCYNPAGEHRKDEYNVEPSKVILELVARRHLVSTRLVASERAKVNKRNARP